MWLSFPELLLKGFNPCLLLLHLCRERLDGPVHTFDQLNDGLRTSRVQLQDLLPGNLEVLAASVLHENQDTGPLLTCLVLWTLYF